MLAVRKVDTRYRFGNSEYFGFEHFTFVPFGKRLLEQNLLTTSEKQWINNYHQECRDVLGPLLDRDNQASSWLEQETEPLH